MKADKYFSDPKVVAMVSAAESGDATRVAEQVHAGADPNAFGKDRATPLLVVMASTANKAGIVALVQNGANPALPSTENIPPIAMAVRMENSGPLLTFLQLGVDPNTLGDGGRPLIMIAAMSERWDNLQLLLNAGAHLDATDSEGYTAAMELAMTRKMDRVAWFLNKGANPHVTAKNGATLAMFVATVVVPQGSPQYPWRQKVVEMLAAQGIQVPAAR